jgi:hypothetical protein
MPFMNDGSMAASADQSELRRQNVGAFSGLDAGRDSEQLSVVHPGSATIASRLGESGVRRLYATLERAKAPELAGECE